MDQSKMLELQVQMRQNNSEVQDFMRDLDGWEKDMKKKDEQIKTNQVPDTTPKELPPIRNSLEKKKKKKKGRPKKNGDLGGEDTQTSSVTEKESTRISGYDFQAWDKFDADKALEEIDDERASTSSEYETDEEWEQERKQKQAVVLKDQGNQHFKSCEYDQAVEFYTRGLECDPQNAILRANRAMALLKQEKYGAAEVDCTSAISIDPMYIKAYSRRASVRISLGRLEDAKRDFEKILKLEPTNRFAKSELEKLEERLNPAKFEEEVTSDTGIVKPIYKSPDQRSKKPLRRIKIEEIGGDQGETVKRAIAKTEATQSEAKRKEVAKDAVLFENFTKTTTKQTDSSPVEYCETPEDAIKTVNSESECEVESKREEEKTRTGSSRLKTAESKVVQSSSCNESLSPQTSPRLPPVPTSSFQFQADWKVLRSHPEKFYQYFKAISPGQYVKLFGQALDADILLMIFKTLRDFYVTSGEDTFCVLQNLAKVKRFSMTIMFMSGQEKQGVRDLIGHLRKEQTHSSEEIDKLTKTYDI